MATHTATPWQLMYSDIPHHVPHEIIANVDLASDATSYTRICEMVDCDPETNANAEFIVRAVNAHESLVLEAKNVIGWFRIWQSDDYPKTGRIEMVDSIECLERTLARIPA